MKEAKKLKLKVNIIMLLFISLSVYSFYSLFRFPEGTSIKTYIFFFEISRLLLMGAIILFGINYYINYFVIEKPNAKYKTDKKCKQYYTYSLISGCAFCSSMLLYFMSIFKYGMLKFIIGINYNYMSFEETVKCIEFELSVYAIYCAIFLLLFSVFGIRYLMTRFKIVKIERKW